MSEAIPKTVFNKRLREKRKQQGLVEVRIWVPKDNRGELVAEFERLVNRKLRGD